MNRMLWVLAFVAALNSRGLTAQVTYEGRCPTDSVDTVTEDGITFHGIPARRYVEGFLNSDPGALSRTSTGTSGLDAGMLAPLYEAVEADRAACTRLNQWFSNGASAHPSRPWVYFRAGNYFFVAAWTRAQSLSAGFRTGYGTVMVFDADLRLLGVWTA